MVRDRYDDQRKGMTLSISKSLSIMCPVGMSPNNKAQYSIFCLLSFPD